MIAAAEALKLPGAQLTAEQRTAADKLEAEIEEHIRSTMEHRGCEFKTGPHDHNVIAEVNQRLKNAGYNPNWQQMMRPHQFNRAIQECVAMVLFVSPSDAAYRESSQNLFS